MNSKFVIRNETAADISAISEMAVAAFKDLETGNIRSPNMEFFADDIKCRSGRDGGSEDEA